MTDKLLEHLKRALGDSYTIERELSGGGMSRVFVAREQALGREVVVKVLPRELALGVNRERFQQEVQLAARLSHPYIVPLLHAGEHDDLLWFTMPYISGDSLKLHLERSGPMPVREVVQLSRDIAEALAYAHSRGVIHRDIKPANILVDGGHALVTDFGVAKALSAALPAAGAGHTATGMAIGTPTYMAPEQLAADPAANHRVDIYALGLLMYELLAGSSPFSTPSPTATMTAQLTRMPDPLETLRSDVPAGLSQLITHCLAKNPEERPASADDVLKALDQISGEMAAAAHLSGESRQTMKRMVPITGVLALIAIVATATAVIGSRKNNPPATPTVEALPVNSSDAGTTMSLQTPQTPQLLTHEDSMRYFETLAGQLGVKAPKSVLDTGVLARLVAQMDSMRAQLAKQQAAPAQAPPSQGAATVQRIPGTDPSRAFINPDPNRLPQLPPEPRKVYVFTSTRGGRGSDTTLRALNSAILKDVTSRLGRGWEIVGPDSSLSATQNQAAFATADAWINIDLERRPGRDSVALYSIVTVKGSGYRVARDTIAKPTGGADFREAVGQLQRSFFQMTMPPAGMQQGGFDRGGRRGGNGRLGGGPSAQDSIPAPNPPQTPPVKRGGNI